MTGTVPAVLRDLELSEPLPSIAAIQPDGRLARRAWLLVRLFTEPLGVVQLDIPQAGLTPSEIATEVDRAFGAAIRSRTPLEGQLPTEGVRLPETSKYLATRQRVLCHAPPITVVVCTRERPAELARCLNSLLDQDYPHMRIMVVDNAPMTAATAVVVSAAARRGPVDYLVEDRPGLSHARNTAVRAMPGEILAWIDDDVVADRWWLAEVARALTEHPAADVISGVIVPAELETEAQVWFEQFGGHSKGRGFTPAVFSPGGAGRQSPLYPLPPFGTGANMTFRPGVIEAIGGFDPALGAGSPAMGSEDTLAFTKVLLAGGTIVYAPSALVRHYHRRDFAGLETQMRGYGTGLTAAYTSLVMSDPKLVLPLLGLIPTAWKDIFSHDTVREAGLRDDFPRELLGTNRRAMLRGPIAYLQGRRQERALGRNAAASLRAAA